jgi:hypothetical protein
LAKWVNPFWLENFITHCFLLFLINFFPQLVTGCRAKNGVERGFLIAQPFFKMQGKSSLLGESN